ncbi:MAG: DNA polymerase I [Clostridia bacterium]|nr:DNA polymerase I [Clostridia bacterium]
MKLLAIDGNSIINRAFYGIRLLTTKDGKYTNAVYGFINILNRLKELHNPDGIAVAFDVKKPTFRHEKYAEYKAGRHATPEELLEQFAPLKEWLTAMGYTVIECPGFEADDILGTLAGVCENSGNECVIATGDKDSLQLISPYVTVALSATRAGAPEVIHFGEKALFEKYGLTPKGMIELKALMGDSSDNIPGVAGVGEKTATDLISRFGSIDYIYEHLEELDIKAGVKAKLEAGKESAFFSRWLGTISKEAPINLDINAYKDKPINQNEVARIMTSLEFFKLMEKMGISPVATKVQENTTQTEIKEASLEELIKTEPKKVSMVMEYGGFGVSANGLSAFAEKNEGLDLLANENIEKVLFDYKNIYKEVVQNGVTPKNVVFDTMLAGYVCNPSASSYDLERLSAEYSAVAEINSQDEAIRLAAINGEVAKALEKELKETGQDKLFYEIELPLAAVLGDMEMAGIALDKQALILHGEALAKQIAELEKEIFSLIGYEFNLNSPKQLGVALFEELGLPCKKKTKSGYSTNAEVLEELRNEHPAVSKIIKYRGLAKLKSTYCDSLVSATEEDGRIHSTFNQTETRTGRISSLEPNLQNIPVRTEEGRVFRKFFIADSGKTLVDADYSQIELRVLAHMANDQVMCEAFNSGADIHTSTAAEVFGMHPEFVTPLMRSRAKAVNFGIVYGIGAFSLAKDIGVSNREAKAYIESYLKTFEGVASFMEKTISSAKENGYVTTIFGRRRYLPELSSSNHMLRAFGERVARNAPIQGTAADIIKIAMVNVFKRLKAENINARLILQVHDELIIESDEACAELAAAILKEEMQNAAKMKVELTADVNIGKTWYEAKG